MADARFEEHLRHPCGHGERPSGAFDGAAGGAPCGDLIRVSVAVDDDGAILGTYYLKPNHEGGGAHVCNCGYMVAEQARGRGVASQLCEHSQAEARRRGFRAMQFNFVVSTNERAVRLWQSLGFQVVGRLPGAFRHPALGFVDALVMFRGLGPASR